MFLETLNKTILNIWPQLTIFIVVLIAVRIVAIRNSSKKFCFHEEFLNLMFIIYILKENIKELNQKKQNTK